MRTFTPTEIDLCKKIAEKERKAIGYGDWLLNEGGFTKVWPYRHNCKRIDIVPLWQEHDCLERLKMGGYQIQLAFLKSPKWSNYCHAWKSISGEEYNTSGKTPLEALLSAVLAVMEGK